MLDDLKEEAIVNKVGGRFKLSTLIQKRLVALNGGSRPLVDLKTDNKLEIVIQEIIQDKIYLDPQGKVAIAGEQGPDQKVDAGLDRRDGHRLGRGEPIAPDSHQPGNGSRGGRAAYRARIHLF